jgi:HPt (histidine-containing phosphotransfer) domain-containing protein
MQTRMSELARKFVTRTAEDLSQMREALARNDLELIRQLAHRSCGTGGTLGLVSLSDAAGNLERLIDAGPDGVPDGARRAQIAAGIEAIAARLDRC